MRIGVLSEGEGLSSYVAEDFGHAPWLLIVDSETLDYEAVRNEFADLPGAGMKVAEAVASLGLDAVVTGGIGPHGYKTLTDAGVAVSFDEDGTVEEAVEAFKRRRRAV